MAEFLFCIDPAKINPGTHLGEPVMIEENGHGWGAGELNPAIFRIVKVPLLPVDLARRVFFREGVTGAEKAALAAADAALEAAERALRVARSEVPQDAAKIAAAEAAVASALAEWQTVFRRVRAYPGRRFLVDMTALGAGTNKTTEKLRDSSRRKGLIAFRDAKLAGATLGECLAAALAAATPVVDFNTATTED